MSFASPTYAAFLFAVVVVYWLLPWRRAQHVLLLAASYTFYAWWDWRFAGLMVASTLVDYVAGAAIAGTENARRRRGWLWFSLAANLGILGFFKYCNFFIDSAITVAGVAGVTLPDPALQIVLPIGISFFTFQSMSYTLDIHAGRLKPVTDPLAFGLYVAFFPQLVAGPIVRARHFLPQLDTRRPADPAQWHRGLERILVGLVKKVVIADSLAGFCDPLFNAPAMYTSVDAWIGLMAFYGQIYCDFSGYSDIAIGSARLLGFEFHENFDRPYLARSPAEFWQRWHISLSTWLRDYLFYPLVFSRRGPRWVAISLLITLTLSGLWHGAAWHFVLWGAWHGVWFLVFEASRRRRRAARRPPLPGWAGWLGTHLIVCLGFWLFRAPDSARLLAYAQGLLRQDFTVSPAAVEALILCGVVVVAESVRPMWHRLARRPALDLALRPALYVAGIYAMLAFGPFDAQAFIYFQF